jgi:hypothetical protein
MTWQRVTGIAGCARRASEQKAGSAQRGPETQLVLSASPGATPSSGDGNGDRRLIGGAATIQTSRRGGVEEGNICSTSASVLRSLPSICGIGLGFLMGRFEHCKRRVFWCDFRFNYVLDWNVAYTCAFFCLFSVETWTRLRF